MNSNDWHKIIATVAPVLATALGGPLAGVAVGAIAKGILPDGTDPTPDNVAAAVMSATPDTLIKLKQIELDFAKSMSDAGIKLEEIAANDRDSARKREVETKDSTTKVLAYVIVGAFIWVVGFTLAGYTTVDSVLAGTLIGYLSAKAELVSSYYFGSSAGSQRKTDALVEAAKVASERPPPRP